MDRRNFFKNAFAAGAVAIAPHAIFKGLDEEDEWQEIVTEKEIDFGRWKAILVWNDKVIAKTSEVEISMEQEAVEVPQSAWDPIPYVEFIPGLMEATVRMHNILRDSDHRIVKQALDSFETLTVYIQAENGDRLFMDCHMVALISGMGAMEGSLIDITYDIELRGVGKLTYEPYTIKPNKN